ncbi:MAG TPA: hypothetical protein VHD61_11135 [Lacunisphaera sp.]|nr:hypothetical protein [Lacunisphaera sp.]
MKSQIRPLTALVLLAGGVVAGLRAGPINLFAFDDVALPYKRNLKLTFEAPHKFPGNPVLAPGPHGSVDAAACSFYGSIIRVGGKFRMWYSAKSDRTISTGNLTPSARIAYAESDDGVHWTKPDLGLTEFAGNRHNNLVALPAGIDYAKTEPLACFVLHEPDDPEPAHRYKMAVYAVYYPSDAERRATGMPADNNPSTILPYFSADGLTWTLALPAPKRPWFDETEVPFTVRNNFEIGGLYKYDGIYCVSGQELSPDVFQPDGTAVRRTMVTHWSGDFVHWSQDKSYSFQRYGYRNVRETLHEAHEPAAVWNRGNVLLATYGLWYGAAATAERRMDLGFLVSNDGVHFREPVADHVFIPAGGDTDWDARGLLHGQGFENVGDQTYIYYGTWDLSGGVRQPGAVGLAIFGRDRLAALSLRDAIPAGGQFTSEPLANTGPATLRLNVTGLSATARLSVELIDKAGAPIAGYSGADAASVTESGFGVKMSWPGGGAIRCANPTYRLRVRFTGTDASRIKFYAAYLE